MSDDILSQAVERFEERSEMSTLTQNIYQPVTEPISDDSEEDVMRLLRDEVPDITESQCKAVCHAVDLADMTQQGGASCVGYQRTRRPMAATKRFAPITETQLKHRNTPNIPHNTLRKNKWATNLFDKWRREFVSCKNAGEDLKEVFNLLSSDRDLTDYQLNELNVILSAFVVALRKADGTEYKGESILSIACGIQRHLNGNGYNVDFFSDVEFKDLKTTIDTTMQDKCARGIGIQKKRANAITTENEEMLRDKGLLGTRTPKALSDAMFWLVGINFGLRGGEEHIGPCHVRIFRLQPTVKDILTWNIQSLYQKHFVVAFRNISPHTARAYEKDRPDRCPVNVFRSNTSKLHPNSTPDVYYYRPLEKPKGNIWFSHLAIGHNKLEGSVKRLMESANIPGYYTNHSLRASTATRLYQAGIPEQLIKEQTGHRSNAVELSDEQKRNVSEILSGPVKVPKLSPSAELVTADKGNIQNFCDTVVINYKSAK